MTKNIDTFTNLTEKELHYLPEKKKYIVRQTGEKDGKACNIIYKADNELIFGDIDVFEKLKKEVYSSSNEEEFDFGVKSFKKIMGLIEVKYIGEFRFTHDTIYQQYDIQIDLNNKKYFTDEIESIF